MFLSGLGPVVHYHSAHMDTPPSLSLIAASSSLRSILTRVDTIAQSDSSVLLIGETGVGKELFAEYIHRMSPRSERPFVKVGLSTLPHELLESELFGHERGSFTSASSEKKGLFELAHTGSIFLDDIDDFPLGLQSKLLRVLESREVMRVGGATPIAVDVRLITATKVDLKQLVDTSMFRSDLYYRINVVPVFIPPLRERPDDIPPLIELMLKRYAPNRPFSLSPEALRILTDYAWPGNVRELRNVIQRICLFAPDRIQPEDLPQELRNSRPLDQITRACHRCFTEEHMTFDEVMVCLEVNLLRGALRQANGNRTRASQLLNMSPSTFRDKLKKHKLNGGI
jgi:two-component system response regulator AtoC